MLTKIPLKILTDKCCKIPVKTKRRLSMTDLQKKSELSEKSAGTDVALENDVSEQITE